MNIITDTGTLLKQEASKELNITLLPLQVAIGSKNYRDAFELDSETFIQMIKTDIPVSSQPAIGEVMEAYEDVQETLHITMTKGLSATYNSAYGIIDAEGIKHVRLFNSKTLAGPQQYLVKLAVKLRDTHTMDEIIERMETCLSECQSFLIPQDFDYLRRGGRLSPIAATLSGVLKIKPIVTQTEGSEVLEKFAVARTLSNAFDKIVQHMVARGVNENHRIFISHALNQPAADLALSKMKEQFPNSVVEVHELTPVMITQGGPGCLAIQYILQDKETVV